MSIQRRQFLAQGMAATVAGAGLSKVFADSDAAKFEVIDCHTHFYDPSRPEGVPWPPKGSPLYRTVLPKDLRQQKSFRRLTGTVVVEAAPRIEDTAWLLELAKSDPFIVGVVGWLDALSADFAKQVQRFAADPLFRGIRVSLRTVAELLKQQRAREFQSLADHDLSLDVNGGPETPATVAELASLLPSLRIVVNHIGNVRITADAPPTAWQNGIRAAAERSNVFCKISSLVEGATAPGQLAPVDLDFYRPYINVVWNAFGDDRVIYGSNWPVSERAADYATLQRIAMDYAAEKGHPAVVKFCAGNARRAYQWLDRPGRR